jgi:hypothetical protein
MRQAADYPPKYAFSSSTWRRLSRSVPSSTHDPAKTVAGARPSRLVTLSRHLVRKSSTNEMRVYQDLQRLRYHVDFHLLGCGSSAAKKALARARSSVQLLLLFSGLLATACRQSGPCATREVPAVIAVRINWQLARDRLGRMGWRRGSQYRRSRVAPVEGRGLS